MIQEQSKNRLERNVPGFTSHRMEIYVPAAAQDISQNHSTSMQNCG
jgi:hypothetical protein